MEAAMELDVNNSEFMAMSPQFPQLPMNVDDPMIVKSIKTNGQFPHFVCLGDTSGDDLQFHADSYLKTHELIRLINKEDPYQGNFDGVSQEFFGFNFLTETCLTESIEHLFNTTRMKYNKIKDHATEASQQIITKTNEKEYLKNRLQIVKFLAFLKSFVINDVNEGTDENEISSLLNQIKNLLLRVGRITSSPMYVTLQIPSKNQTCSPSYHLFHANLDIVWSMTAIFYSLPPKFCTTRFTKLTDDVNMQSHSLFIQYTSFVIWDLIQLALKRFQKVSGSLHRYATTSPFSCSCVTELWILLLNLVDKIQEKQKGKSFWSFVQHIFNGILYQKLNNGGNKETSCDVLEIEPQIECEDRIGFCWWLLLHLASLYEINSIGLKSSEISTKSNYTLLQTLVSLSIQSEKVGEAQMRCYLNCCIKICKKWEPNMDVLFLLWNHFIRNINSNFCLLYSLDGFQSLSDSGDGWLKQVKRRSSGVSNDDNSFHLFLHYFNEKIRKISEDNEWEQFKKRIFSKFDVKSMQDLNETGLHNFVTILLTVACETDVEVAIAKMSEFVEIIPFSCRMFSQKSIVWCGMFALLEICEEKQLENPAFINKLASEFTVLSQQLKNTRTDGMERQQLSKLIFLYLKGIESIIHKSKLLNLSEHTLINSAIQIILYNGTTEEIEKTLSMAEVVLSKLRMVFMRSKSAINPPTQELKAMANALDKHVLKFVKQFCTTQTPPTVLADVAAGLTLMVHDMKILVDTSSLFNHFALTSNFQPLFCSRYLCHVLQNRELVHSLHVERSDVSYLLIASWFRCVISLAESDDCVRELTRLIMKLPAMQNIPSLNDDEDVDKVYVKFLKSLESKFNTFENFAEKMTFKQNTEIIFKDILKHNSSVLKNFEPLEQLRQVYVVAAHVVKHCSLIIYAKSKADGILHTIVHQLLLPRIIYCHDKPLPPNLPIVLRDTLPLFLEGLQKLGPRKDASISNRLKDVVINYIMRFPLKAKLGTSGTQPLLVCLKNHRTNHSEEFFSFALEIIRDQLITRKILNLNLFVKFVHELWNTSVDKRELNRMFFVPLVSLLNQPDPNLKEKAHAFVLKMLPSVLNTETTKTHVKPLLVKFLEETILSSPQNAFKLMDVLALMQPELVKELIPDIGRCIERVEATRGVGQDANLRRLHQNLLKRLSCV